MSIKRAKHPKLDANVRQKPKKVTTAYFREACRVNEINRQSFAEI